MASDPPDDPYDGYEGPAAFADVGDGYPVELRQDKRNSPSERGDPDAPLTPINARRLHHLPPPAPVPDDEVEFGPARTDWRKLMPLAFTLAAAIGLGIWLAIAPTGQQAPEPDEPPSYAQHTPPPRQLPETSAEPSPSPTRTSPSPRQPTSTKPRLSPTASTKQPIRRISKQPTVTVTKTVRTTPTPTRTRTPKHRGLEEPPTSPTCLTWAECHDDPPQGIR